MLIVTLGYLYDAVRLEIEHEAEIEFSNFLAKSALIWKYLEHEGEEAEKTDPKMPQEALLALLFSNISEENYAKSLGGSRPAVVQLRIGSHSRNDSHTLTQEALASLLSTYASSPSRETVSVTDDVLPKGMSVTKTFLTVDDHDYKVIEVPFLGQQGSLTLFTCANVDPMIFYTSLKSVALQALVMFWLGMWGAVILALFVCRRLKHSNATISNAFEALNSARIEAEAANRSKSEFLANMSHELRTPMNAVLGFSEMMKNEVLGPIQNDFYREYADNIHSSGAHLLKLINEVLEVSKIEAGTVQLNESSFDVAEALGHCRVMLADRIGKHQVNVLFDIADDLPNLYADPKCFKQIAMNLIDNGIKYTRAEGSVTVRAMLDEGGGMVFTIQDNGIGIRKTDISRVKERFGRVASSEVNNAGGIGLGLTIVNLLCELHEAEFTLESAYGKGTLATVVFPAERVLHDPSLKRVA